MLAYPDFLILNSVSWCLFCISNNEHLYSAFFFFLLSCFMTVSWSVGWCVLKIERYWFGNFSCVSAQAHTHVEWPGAAEERSPIQGLGGLQVQIVNGIVFDGSEWQTKWVSHMVCGGCWQKTICDFSAVLQMDHIWNRGFALYLYLVEKRLHHRPRERIGCFLHFLARHSKGY